MAEQNCFLRKLSKTLQIIPGNAPKLGATLKGKNLLPEGSKSFKRST